jgi:hypothetical protein
MKANWVHRTAHFVRRENITTKQEKKKVPFAKIAL